MQTEAPNQNSGAFRSTEWAKAAQAAQIGFARLDERGDFVECTPALAAAFGVEPEQLRGREWRSAIHHSDHWRVEQALAEARAGRSGFCDVRSAAGPPSHAALTIVCAGPGGPECDGYLCCSAPVTSAKERGDVLALAVDNAPNGLLILDNKGRIVTANPAVGRLFGYGPEELAGKTVEVLLPEGLREAHGGYRETFHADPTVRAMAGRDLAGRRRDGAEIPLQVYLNVIDLSSGRLILCTIIDIAERVSYQNELQSAMRAAEAANRAKSDFLARMSHEIRTPMNLIMGMGALLLESQLTETQRRHLEICDRNVRRLLRLINGILDLSKVEAGRLFLDAVPFDLSEVLRESAATISPTAERKGLELRVRADPSLWRYWVGDAERLQQVILNLLGNSVKFTETGSIEVNAGPAFGPGGRSGIRIEVADTGCGVPDGKAETIFEAFQQVDGAIDRRFEGTGLGLAIARSLARMMGGDLWLSPKRGPGCLFVMTAFPRRCEAADLPSPASAAAKAASVPEGTRILLVEDNPENVFLVEAFLNGLSVALDFASDGAEGLRKRKANPYDLILMDIQMPVMDGYTATREIRAWEGAQGVQPIPIIALTAHALSHAVAESREAGCDDHVSKPVDRETLVAAIARHIRRGRTTAEGPEKRAPEPLDLAIRNRQPAFLGRRRADLATIRQAAGSGDMATIVRIGHDSKGIGNAYGFPSITRAGAVLEAAAKLGEPGALSAAIDQFAAAVEDAGRGSEPAA
ncbi:MAG: PAS domain S-box protein [Bryobacteraceae bacterium]